MSSSKPKEYVYRLTGRPRSSKNSRVTDRRTGRTFINKGAKTWMDAAKQELRIQHGKTPLTGCYALKVIVHRQNRQHLNDNDSPITVIMDCLKGIVVPDDKPENIGWVEGGTLLDAKKGQEFTEVHLVEMETFTIPGNK